MNKKNLIIWGIILVVLILGGFAFYQYSVNNRQNADTQSQGNLENNTVEQNVDQKNTDSGTSVQMEGIKAEGSNGSGNTAAQGGLIICVDKCGDGICQKDNTTSCDTKGPNCICQETVQECPADCHS